MHCNLVNNSYQQGSKVLLTFTPNKQFGQLITLSPHLLTMLKTTNAEFQSIQLWFTNQNNRPLGIDLGRHYKNEIFNRIKVQKIS